MRPSRPHFKSTVIIIKIYSDCGDSIEHEKISAKFLYCCAKSHSVKTLLFFEKLHSATAWIWRCIVSCSQSRELPIYCGFGTGASDYFKRMDLLRTMEKPFLGCYDLAVCTLKITLCDCSYIYGETH